ncbi:MAG: HlyC/CorC family transporter [Alphaproteobacteria bacterium]|nr:HlyC/CorC family transporter [Alphaproteobacteria bacterium]
MLLIELAVVALLIVVNGLLAMSELAVVSSRPAKLRSMAELGVKGSRRALALASDPSRFLSTVQIGITTVGVLSGAFSGATLGQRLSLWLKTLGLAAGTADILGVGLVVAAITYLSLIIGELVPKQLGLRAPEAIAVRVAPTMTVLAMIGAPLVWLLDRSGKAALRLLGQHEEPAQRVTEEEIKTLIAEAESAGVLEPDERRMITGVMRLGDRPVRAVMTPRQSVNMIGVDADPATARKAIAESPHSRLPVWEGTPDTVIGVVQAKDLLDACLEGKQPSVRDFVRKAPIVPETADALDVVSELKGAKVHMGLVHDEYGTFQGVVTPADIMEAIAGAFRTEEGLPEPAVVRRDDGSFLIAGSMPADEFAELTGMKLPEGRRYHTVAGFVLECLGRLPALGESLDANGWRIEVVDLDGRRIDKLLCKRLAARRRAANR